ncbi:Uncharacterised protein [uncultured archaeon]|nr:Uncharacterised protein [uncultured archaeon]
MAGSPRDDVLGEIKGKMPLYKNGLDVSGEIILCENGLIVRADGNTLKAPFNYVTLLEKISAMPLGKVGVEMGMSDMMGDSHSFKFGISEQHFMALKKACSK